MKISLRNKIIISFSTVIFISFIFFVYFSERTVDKNNDFFLKKEMVETRKNLDVYLKQYFFVNNLEPTNTALNVEANNISKELSNKISNTVSVYDKEGKQVSDIKNPYFKENDEDLKKALKGETAFTIMRIDNKVIINLSYPVTVDNVKIGILRYSRDYTELYKSSEELINVVKMLSIIMVIVIFIISFIISNHITKPIIELTETTKKISQGNLDIYIYNKSNDEVGELGANFKIMVEKIKSQIETIKDDRDRLKELEKHRKIFLDNVTHELKTPITTILGYSQIINQEDFKDEVFFKRGMNHIISESERLNRMVIELLELSKASANEFTYDFVEVDVNKLIKNTCEEMEIKAKKYDMVIKYSLEDNLKLYADWDKLKEVLINLIDNSIKYANVSSVININAFKEEGFICINVADQGKGIPQELVHDIFEPFYKVSKKDGREKGSNGLGLAITKAILEKHNGNIKIESETGVGTIVKIKLPVKPKKDFIMECVN